MPDTIGELTSGTNGILHFAGYFLRYRHRYEAGDRQSGLRSGLKSAHVHKSSEERQMTMRFSLGHLTVLGCAPPELTYIAAQAGYDFVSPRIIMMGNESAGNYTLAENKSMLQQTKSALLETGLRVYDIELVDFQ